MAELEQDSGGDEGGGAPGWMATFADLMPLLLAFFVLLFSFASVDDKVYKEVGGSLEEAFGVQRQEMLMDKVLGVNHIAQEYSSGRPDPNILNIVPQEHLNVDKPNQVPQEMSEEKVDSEDHRGAKDYKGDENSEDASNAQEDLEDTMKQAGGEANMANKANEKGDDLLKNSKDAGAKAAKRKKSEQSAAKGGKSEILKKAASAIKQQKVTMERKKKLETTATNRMKDLGQKLAQEIENGLLEIETKGDKVIIRMSEDASFLPGSSDIIGPFQPIVEKIGGAIKSGAPGKVIVAGHTDSLPVAPGGQYRSNWELSSARASTITEGLIRSDIARDKFEVVGHADTQPVALNDSPENRSKNRRVEIVLQYDSEDLVPEEYEDQLPEEEEDIVEEVFGEVEEKELSEFEKALQKLVAEGETDDGRFDKIFQNDFFK